MNLRPNRPRPPDINLTPLIDVVFLLLIFFMVSTVFEEDTRIQVRLPEAQGEEVVADEPRVLEITIDRSGAFHIGGQAVGDPEVETLKQAISDAIGAARDLPVLIRADAETPHQAVMTVMDAASRLGLLRFAFAATPPDAAR